MLLIIVIECDRKPSTTSRVHWEKLNLGDNFKHGYTSTWFLPANATRLVFRRSCRRASVGLLRIKVMVVSIRVLTVWHAERNAWAKENWNYFWYRYSMACKLAARNSEVTIPVALFETCRLILGFIQFSDNSGFCLRRDLCCFEKILLLYIILRGIPCSE